MGIGTAGGCRAMAAPESYENQPINFGKRLAHTDKSVRDRGFKTLKKWLAKNPNLERLEFMKLWKGLYFGVWMADKRPVQQELAVNIAVLLNDVPRSKQGMWIDTFWDTMQASWEKLDVHRISKYLLFIRIVIAEVFKVMRVAGWPFEEMCSLGNTFTRATPMHAKEGPNAPSVGLILQFTRILWDELRPQLERASTPTKAIMSLLEPFCILSEASAIDALVRHIHEHVFRRAPHELLSSLVPRILEGAARPDVSQKNRQALYDTADVLERLARNPLPKNIKPLLLVGDTGSKVVSILGALPSLELPPPSQLLPVDQMPKTKGKKRKSKKKAGSGVDKSPLVLPQASLPLSDCEEAVPRVVKRKKVKRRQGDAILSKTEAASGAQPKRKRRL